MTITEEAVRHEDRIRHRIRAARMKRAWSQEKLARKAEVSKETIRLMETGERNPNLKTLHLIANAFGCSIADLLADSTKDLNAHNSNQNELNESSKMIRLA